MKKLGLLVIGLIALIILPFNINAAKKEPITVHIFRGEGCGYCKAALSFFDSIEEEYGDYFDLETHEVWYDEDNANWMKAVAEHFNEDVGGVPYIIIGEKTFQGYAESYDEDIIKTIKSYYEKGNFEDQVIKVKGNKVTSKSTSDNEKTSDTKDYSNSSKKDSNKTTIIIVIVAVIGFIALIYFARDNEEEIEEVKKEEPKEVEKTKEEVKTTPKKTTAKKTTTKKPVAKKTATKKTTTKKNSKK